MYMRELTQVNIVELIFQRVSESARIFDVLTVLIHYF